MRPVSMAPRSNSPSCGALGSRNQNTSIGAPICVSGSIACRRTSEPRPSRHQNELARAHLPAIGQRHPDDRDRLSR
jgi:hypothetical protein